MISGGGGARVPVVYLTPGGLYAAAAPCRIATLLGSCIAVTLWSPITRVGGMSHYLLPRHARPVEASPRYGETALTMLLARLEVLGGDRRDLLARVYGGAVVDATSGSVAADNIAVSREFLRRHEIRVVDEQVGGRAGRRVAFDVDDGSVRVEA